MKNNLRMSGSIPSSELRSSVALERIADALERIAAADEQMAEDSKTLLGPTRIIGDAVSVPITRDGVTYEVLASPSEVDTCKKCGKRGFKLDEFTSPHTGLCAECSKVKQ